MTERRGDVSAGGERGRDYTAVVLGRWSAVEIQASSRSDLATRSDPSRPPDPSAEGFGPQAEASEVWTGSGP